MARQKEHSAPLLDAVLAAYAKRMKKDFAEGALFYAGGDTMLRPLIAEHLKPRLHMNVYLSKAGEISWTNNKQPMPPKLLASCTKSLLAQWRGLSEAERASFPGRRTRSDVRSGTPTAWTSSKRSR